jgi:hypothetical protein
MKKNVTYQCEICQKSYGSEYEALKCEAKGFFDSKMYPAGLMWEYNHHGYVGIFSLPKDVRPDSHNKDGHIGHSSYWACRASNYIGDSLGSQLCGGDFFKSDDNSFEQFKSYRFISDEKICSDEFKRMVAYLKSANIQPSYYNKSGELILVTDKLNHK